MCQYLCAAKLAVVTEPRAAPGSGPVVVQTKSGGVGVSWINFSFVVENKATAEGQKNATNGCNYAHFVIGIILNCHSNFWCIGA